MKKAVILIFLLFNAVSTFGQWKMKFQMPFDYLSHFPRESDEANVKKYAYLSNRLPDSTNAEEYSALAASLWQLGRLEKAKYLYLRLIHGDARTIDHPSGTQYGYGSYTSNYKNEAALGLALIYVEQQQFDSAFLYLEDAVKKYEVSFSCGTGSHALQREYQFLYASIYEGQQKYDSVMEILLPECLSRNDQIVVRTIKKLYTTKEIKDKLDQAELSMKCNFDKEPSYSYKGRFENGKMTYTDTLTYYSGSATMMLFGRQVSLERPDLENGEHVTREKFLNEFRETSFYTSLMKE